MEMTQQIINSISSIAVFLATFPALWISGRIILRNIVSENRIFLAILWLALAGWILMPLIDIVGYLSSLFDLVILNQANSVPISLVLGLGPFRYYLGINILLGFVVYAFVTYSTYEMLAGGEFPLIRQRFQVTKWETIFVLLGFAAMVNQVIKGTVLRFVTIYLPDLTAQQELPQLRYGFWASWLIGMMILIGVLFLINQKIKSREIETP